ncbi:MAG: hypothetical protein PF961_05785 [Planctomycetota bacterium]|jgi:sialate O-acetylesterase|nr:hypothetical protein [Planctomycetota bacterium]
MTSASWALELAAPFGDHMVLQRAVRWDCWGHAEPGAVVVAQIAGHSGKTTADKKGAFRIGLPALSAGGPFELVVTSGDQSLVCADVLVGELWLASGQSNMEWPVSATSHAEESGRAAADLPQLRLLAMANYPAARPGAAVPVPQWQRADAGVDTWSAVAFETARRIHQGLGVPVGVIQADWGGTRIEAWMPSSAVDDDADFAKAVANDEAGPRRQLALAETSGATVRAWRDSLAGKDGSIIPDPGRQVVAWDWHRPDIDLDGWGSMKLPTLWEKQGLYLDGAVWFRREITVPNDWKGKDLVLELGAIDDFDEAFLDGRSVGSVGPGVTNSWQVERKYTIPGKQVRPGKRWLAVRVYDHWGGGGFNGKPEQMRIYPKVKDGDKKAISLAGDWRWRVELAIPERPKVPDGGHNQTTVLFNGMIAPVAGLRFAGVLWYQGESDAGQPNAYARYFPIMIKRWRQALGDRDLPFLFVQLPRYGKDSNDPNSASWARIREAQAAALAVPKVQMAVTIDLGDPKDIHPRDKRPIGERLSWLALAEVYGRDDIAAQAPRFRAMDGGDKEPLRLHFDQADGLATSDGKAPRAFYLAGRDKRWFAAKSELKGGAVVLSHPEVDKPVAVRYAWTASPSVNVVNAAGLPLTPFRTDDW